MNYLRLFLYEYMIQFIRYVVIFALIDRDEGRAKLLSFFILF